jgi:hypothetical protein
MSTQFPDFILDGGVSITFGEFSKVEKKKKIKLDMSEA